MIVGVPGTITLGPTYHCVKLVNEDMYDSHLAPRSERNLWISCLLHFSKPFLWMVNHASTYSMGWMLDAAIRMKGSWYFPVYV